MVAEERKSTVATITATISSLKQVLDAAISTESKDLARLQIDIRADRRQWQTLVNCIDGLTKAIKTLDTDDPEEIKKIAWEHQWSVVDWTPDANFNVQTDFPIRYFNKDDKPPTSKWKRVSDYEGQTQFSAVLKNSKHRSASIELKLYGHRREVFADKIKSLQQEREAASRQRDDLARSISGKEARLNEFKAYAATFVPHRSLAEIDLLTLKNYKPKRKGLDTSNPYMLAVQLRLQSKFHRIHVIDQRIRAMMETQAPVSLFSARKAWLLQIRAHRFELANFITGQDGCFGLENSAALSADIYPIRQLQTTLKTKAWPKTPATSQKSNIKARRATSASSTSRETNSIKHQTAGERATYEYTKTIEDFQTHAAKALTDCILSLEETYINRHRFTDWTDCKDRLIRDELVSRLEIEATSTALANLQSDAWPIGAYLCFTSTEDLESGCELVREGIRQSQQQQQQRV